MEIHHFQIVSKGHYPVYSTPHLNWNSTPSADHPPSFFNDLTNLTPYFSFSSSPLKKWWLKPKKKRENPSEKSHSPAWPRAPWQLHRSPGCCCQQWCCHPPWRPWMELSTVFHLILIVKSCKSYINIYQWWIFQQATFDDRRIQRVNLPNMVDFDPLWWKSPDWNLHMGVSDNGGCQKIGKININQWMEWGTPCSTPYLFHLPW